MGFVYCGLGVLLGKGNSAVVDAVAGEAEAMAEVARAAAPVATGTLSGGIDVEVSGKTATVTTTAETNPGEAFYEEVGSGHNAANRYMQSAAIASTTTFPERMAAESRAVF